MCHFSFMKKANLKYCAPQARKDFIAALYGVGQLFAQAEKGVAL